MAVLYCLRSIALAHKKTKYESSTCTIKKNIRQWKHKLKDAQLFVARQLAQSGKQDKTFTCPSWYSLAHGKRASVKLHLCSYSSYMHWLSVATCTDCFLFMTVLAIGLNTTSNIYVCVYLIIISKLITGSTSHGTFSVPFVLFHLSVSTNLWFVTCVFVFRLSGIYLCTWYSTYVDCMLN
jgi:hypothetical protein